MICTASPGWFCPPLYTHPTLCPEDWYCPGGLAMARRCPDSRWSAVGSIYPEDCLEHMNVGLAVVFVLFFIFLVLGVCRWFVSYDWAERDQKYPYAQYAEMPPFYGETVKNGQRFQVYSAQDACRL